MEPKIRRISFGSGLRVMLIGVLLSLGVRSGAEVISGSVLGPEGKPVVGARVTYYGFEDRRKALGQTTTSNHGLFSVNIAHDSAANSPAGACIVDAPGYAISYSWLKWGRQSTVQLSLPGAVSGLVTDASGTPIADATLYMDGLRGPGSNVPADGGVLIEFPQSFKTDAHGRYRITRVPQGMSVRLGLRDPRFVNSDGTLVPVGQTAAPLIAQPGAVIHGRIAYEGGKAATSIGVFAQSVTPGGNGWSKATTDARGDYTLTGLPAGSYNVCVTLPNKPDGSPADWIGAAATGIAAAEGQTTAAPEIVLTHGALVTGVVTDTQTGASVPQVNIGSYGPARPSNSPAIISASTDTSGRYTLRVAPGSNSVYVCGVPQAYVAPDQSDMRRFTLAAGGTHAESFRVTHGLSVQGVTLNEQGQPVMGIAVTLQKQPQDWADLVPPKAASAGDGAFTVDSLPAGRYKIFLDPEWTVVSPETVTIPAAMPIRLIVRPQTLTTLTSKIVDRTGAPVPDVALSFLTFAPNSPVGNTLTAVSDATGSFALHGLVPGSQITTTKVEHAGYLLISGGTVTVHNSGFAMDPLVLAPMSASFSGIVRDTHDAPVAGAWVICAGTGGPSKPVQTDTGGQFHFTGLATGAVTVYAAKGHVYKHQILQEGSDSKTRRITLDTHASELQSADLQRGDRILSKLLAAAQGTSYYAAADIPSVLAAYSPELAVQFLQSHGRKLSDADIIGILDARAQIDPEATARWGMPHIQAMQNKQMQGSAAVQLGLMLALIDKKKAAQLYHFVGADAGSVSGSNPEASDAQTEMLLSTFAAAVHAADTDALVQKSLALIAVADKAAPSSRTSLRTAYAGFLAAGDVAWARKIADTLPLKDQAQAYADIVTNAARNDPQGALAAFRVLSGPANGADDFSYGKAAQAVIPILADKDPQAASHLTQSLKSTDFGPSVLTIAADNLPLSQAGALYREAITVSSSRNFSAFTPALIAAHAWVRDQKLGRALFDMAAAKIDWSPQDPDRRLAQPIADFAFYYARVDPAYSRLLLEKQSADDTKGVGTNQAWSVFHDALAMASVDVDRAIEMANAIPDTTFRLDAARKIAQYVVAPQSVRDTLRFDRWCATDTWTPGTPTGW